MLKQEEPLPSHLTFKCKFDKNHVSYVSSIHISHKKHIVPDLFKDVKKKKYIQTTVDENLKK